MANVVFVWHMHQPYYVNSASKLAMMPWVRLHAVKGYLDMISVLADFPRIHVNFNLTPVLMLQIEELVTGTVRDLWLEWSKKPADELAEHEHAGWVLERIEDFNRAAFDGHRRRWTHRLRQRQQL